MNTRDVLFFGVLALALIHGMLYLTLVPPWDHYDEPTHFEYAWLIAARLCFPQPGDCADPIAHLHARLQAWETANQP